MFGKRKSQKELKGPRLIPDPVQKSLVNEWKMDIELARLLKAVILKGESGKPSGIRIFDESDAMARNIVVKDYSSLSQNPELVLYEGWFDEDAKQVKLEEKKKITADTKLFTQAEIRQAIEGLKEPGSTVFFYQARGTAHGGPLAMGAAVIELNPAYPGKKQKKYNIYQANVVDLQPVGKGLKIFDSDKPKEIAAWVMQSHEKRQY